MTNPIATLVCALALCLPQVPQDPAPATQAAIERFAAAMQATGLTFAKSSSGKSYTLSYDHDGSRRTVFVALRPETPSGLFVHSIYTTVWNGAQPPDEATLRKVFGSAKKLGAFYLVDDGKGNWVVRFGVCFDATDLGKETKAGDTAAKRLRDVIEFVDTVGAATEKELAK